MTNLIYLDHNATAPVDADVLAKLPEWAAAWGNPSSIHAAGRAPKAMMREARRQIAEYLHVDPLELILTSGGSEANNLALFGLGRPQDGRDQIIISSVEHPSLRLAAARLKQIGYTITVIPVSREGELDLQELERRLTARTRLVSIMQVNNETGHVFPIGEIARMAHAVGALVHCDTVQALGKLELDLRALGVDMASFSGHKFYALKGIGILYVRRGLNLESQLVGGAQERQRRAGTENVLALASLGFMCAKKGHLVAGEAERLGRLRDRFEQRAVREIGGVRLTGAGGTRVGSTSNIVLDGVDGETLLMGLDVRGFAVSTGAACSSGSPEPSPILLAMGLTRAEAQGSLRTSLGWQTSEAEMDAYFDALAATVSRLRGMAVQRVSGEL